MRGPPRGGSGSSYSFLSSRGAKLLIGLPLLLAGFAFALQFSGPRNTGSKLTLTGLPEIDSVDLHGGQNLKSRSLITNQGALPSGGSVNSKFRQIPDADFKPTSYYNESGVRIAFVSTTAEGYPQTKQWVDYHHSIGVTHFYLFVDGIAATPEVSAQLKTLPGVVRVIPRDDELKYTHDHSRIWNETWLSAFFNKPCNHELFVRQSLNMEEAIKLAREDQVDWILHIDTDELVYPGGSPEYSLQQFLGTQPAEVDMLVFPNYESMPESSNVVRPFEEVTLFKRNFAHVDADQYFKNYRTVSKGNPNYFITYGNGKSAARVREGLRPNGAHRWYSYEKAPVEETTDTGAVLHYTYNRFGDLKSRRDRCDCAPTEEDAERCFILPFDRLAFLAASHKSDDELRKWFDEHLIWDDPKVVNELVKNGLFIRAYEPAVIVKGARQESERQEKIQKNSLVSKPGSS